MTLALLIMAVGGAWAQSSLNVVELKAPAEWETDESNLTPADLPGFYTSTFDKAKAWTGAPTDGAAMLIYAFEGDDAHYVYFDKGTPEDKDYKFTFTKASVLFMTKIYYTVEPANPTEWLLTPDADKKVWTLYKMPASNIELQVEYYAESNIFLSKDALADKTNIAVKAGELGVEFGEDGKSANTITEGTPMTVTYNGTKKVIGFKAAKKAPTEGHALSASAVGEIVGSDGKAYAVEDKDDLPSGVTAVAMVAYKSGSNGLAIQLNSNPVSKNWADAKTYPEGLTAVSGGTWRLPSMADWQNMFVSCAVSGDAGASTFMNPIAGFSAKIAATGITWLPYNYWSSTESDAGAWNVFVYLGDTPYGAFYESETSSYYSYLVLACLAF